MQLIRDKDYKPIDLLDKVIVPEPGPEDDWNEHFIGTVESFLDYDYISVEHPNGFSYVIEAEIVTKI